MIPMVDLKEELNILRNPIMNAIKAVIESGSYILGEKGRQLEKEIADYVGASYGIGVANGTDALFLSLKSLGIGPGDEVITTPFTFFATGEVIANAGATPIFVDIDEETYNIDSNKIRNAISSKTKAIIVVHLFGQSAKMESIKGIAEEFNLRIIEDACQAIGTEYNGKRIGSIGDIGCFSFFPSKNLGAFGDAGIIITNEKELFERLISLRNHGSKAKYEHSFLGFNSRLDEIQAAILLEKLKFLDMFIDKRIEIAKNYSEELKDLVKTPSILINHEHTYHQYCIETPYRKELMSFLEKNQIASSIYYPIPLHLQKAFDYLGYQKGDFPIAEKVANTILALPISPTLIKEKQDYIISVIKDFFNQIE
jgi:UDP-2-acetamido-2-deoxy-ribo-hexuluronate aminotransferase